MASASKPSPPPATTINTLLLASACSGDLKGLNILLTGQGAAGDEELPFDDLLVLPAYAVSGTTPESLLKGVTAEGNTALHAVATNGDGDNFLSCADLIYGKAKHDILFVQNERGDTPLHLAARAGKYKMVVRLVALAKGIVGGTSPAIASDATRVKALLETKNKLNETVLHEAVRVKSDDMVWLLMEEDPQLAMIPEQGSSPLYLAISLDKEIIVSILYKKSDGLLSYSGPNGKNALHAAVGTCPVLTKLLLEWNIELTTGRDENGSTPLHFAAGLRTAAGGGVCRRVLIANPATLYQSDEGGLFPIHVAASVGAYRNVTTFVKKCPGSAGLLDANGRTFLHVAAQKKLVSIVHIARMTQSVSWILNMQDKDGNTALHLAVQEGSFRTVCALLMSLQVEVNLTNCKGHTPFDVSRYKIPPGLFHDQNSGVYIQRALTLTGAGSGASRMDRFSDNHKCVYQLKYGDHESKESREIRDTTENLSIGSVLIATVTFGATFAVPGGYRADEHVNGGAPTLAGRYAFDAFMVANTISFVCSSIATIGFMHSGTSLVDLPSRKFYLGFSAYLMRTSISSLTTAFALAAYILLAPVAHKTAIAICVLASLVVLSSEMELWVKRYILARPLRARKGLVWTIKYFMKISVIVALTRFWPIIFSFGFAIHPSKHHPVPTMPPPPLA